MSNGCSYANLFIYSNPKKVQAKEAMSKEWYVGCKFYDPAQVKKYPKVIFGVKRVWPSTKHLKKGKKLQKFLLMKCREP